MLIGSEQVPILQEIKNAPPSGLFRRFCKQQMEIPLDDTNIFCLTEKTCMICYTRVQEFFRF